MQHTTKVIRISENRNVAVNLSTMSLRNALSNPDDVAILLLFQLDERIENSKMKLVHECILHQLHLHKCRIINFQTVFYKSSFAKHMPQLLQLKQELHQCCHISFSLQEF